MPGSRVSNTLNPPQSKIFTKFPQKTFLKPHETIISLFRNVNDSKNYFGCVVDGIFSRAHTLFFSIRTSNFLAEAEPGLNVLIFLGDLSLKHS